MKRSPNGDDVAVGELARVALGVAGGLPGVGLTPAAGGVVIPGLVVPLQPGATRHPRIELSGLGQLTARFE